VLVFTNILYNASSLKDHVQNVFWNVVAMLSAVSENAYCLHDYDPDKNENTKFCQHLFNCSPASDCQMFACGAVMMEAVSTSKTSVNFYQITWRKVPEDSHLHTHKQLTAWSMALL
jgi:hypothetical protein